MDLHWIFAYMEIPYAGIMFYGGVEVSPETSTGVFEGKAMTARRLTALIHEMKF